jgi:hypothetical protein
LMRAWAADAAIEMAQDVLHGTAAPTVSGAAPEQPALESVCCRSLTSFARSLGGRAPSELTARPR